MNKQELMENYTMEQLADMVVALNIAISDMKNTKKIIEQYNSKQCDIGKISKDTLLNSNVFNSLRSDIQSPLTKSIADNYEVKIQQKEEKIIKLEKEREKFRNQRNTLLAEFNELKSKFQHKETTINQIDDILNELFGISFNGLETIEQFEGFKGCLKKIIKNNKSFGGVLPTEPISFANKIIKYGADNHFNISEIRQIAEHLLVYCNANESEEI